MSQIVVTMTEYIECSRCYMTCINDDDHIERNFGYNRSHVRFKNCIKCREKDREQKRIARSRKYRQSDVQKYVNDSNGTLQYCKICDNVLSIDNFLKFDQPEFHEKCNVLFGGRWLKWKCNSCISENEKNMIIRMNGLHNGTIKSCSRCNQDKHPDEFVYKGKPRGFCSDCIDKCSWLQ